MHTVWVRGYNGFGQMSSTCSQLVSDWLPLYSTPQKPRESVDDERGTQKQLPLVALNWHSTYCAFNDVLTIQGHDATFTGRKMLPPSAHIKKICAGDDRLAVLTGDGCVHVLHIERASQDVAMTQWRRIVLQSGAQSSGMTQTSNCVADVCVGAHSLLACSPDGDILSMHIGGASEPLVAHSLSAGREHFLVVTTDGAVYSCGGGGRGQLGLGDLEEREHLCHVACMGGIKVAAVSAGAWHSAALSRDGDVYVWGWNVSGQLGRSTRSVNVSSVCLLVDALPTHTVATRISCGARHTLVLLDDGRVFGWGWNAYCQLTSSLCCDVIMPRVIDLPLAAECGRVVDVIAGGWGSALVCCNY